MIAALRTKPSFHNSSATPSLRSTSAGSPDTMTASLRRIILASPMPRSPSMRRCAIGEQQIVNLLLQPAGAAVIARDPVDIDDLGLDPAGMRRQQQDTVADLDGLRDRMGDEQHREFGLFPELQQFVLAGPPRPCVERCERPLHPH